MIGTDYRQMVKEARGLPALASVVTRVMTAVIEETSAREIAQLIEKDASITARVLKVINSAYYGLSGHVSTVSQAVPLLGIQVVKNIVLTFSVMDIFAHENAKGVDFKKLWEHAFTTAVASRILAERVGYPDREEALVAGLLHDIGILLFVKNDLTTYAEAVKVHKETGRALTDVEEELMGITHAELGALLAEKWHLPEVIVLPIRHHHSPGLMEGGGQVRKLTQAVYEADRLCDLFLVPQEQEAIVAYQNELYRSLGIKERDLLLVMTEITREVEETSKTFMVEVESPRSYVELLEQAHLELGRMNLSYLMSQEANK